MAHGSNCAIGLRAPGAFVSGDDFDQNFRLRYSTGPFGMAYVVQRPAVWNRHTVVFIPGFGRTMRFWDLHTSILLGLGYQVVRVDPVGVGESLRRFGVPSEGPGLVVNASALRSLLVEDLALTDNVFIVGHSLGAGFAGHLCAKLDRLGGVVLAHPYAEWLTNHYGNFGFGNWGTLLAPFGPYSARSLAEGSLLQRTAAELTGMDHETEVAAQRAIIETIKTETIYQPLSTCHAPVLMITSRDPLEPSSLMRKVSGSLSDRARTTSKYMGLAGVDHFFPEKDVSGFMAILLLFLQSPYRPYVD